MYLTELERYVNEQVVLLPPPSSSTQHERAFNLLYEPASRGPFRQRSGALREMFLLISWQPSSARMSVAVKLYRICLFLMRLKQISSSTHYIREYSSITMSFAFFYHEKLIIILKDIFVRLCLFDIRLLSFG